MGDRTRKLLKGVGLGVICFWAYLLGYFKGYFFNVTFRDVFWQEHKVDALTVCQIQMDRMNEDLISAQTGESFQRKKDKELRRMLQRNIGIYRNQNK